MRKSIVLIDMDEVVVDLVDSWLAMYESLGGEHVERSAVKEYFFEKSGLIKDLPLFWKAIDRAPALRIARPMPGAIGALKRLYEDPRLEVHLVTYARHESWGKAHEAKLAWLWQYAPWLDRDQVTFTRQKHLMRGDYLIEDNADTCEKWLKEDSSGCAILIDHAWNKTAGILTHATRVNNLAEAANLILELEDGQ